MNKTVVYNYDASGNITSKVVSGFTLSDSDPAGTSVAYGYASDGLKGRLISYNGKNLSNYNVQPYSYYGAPSVYFNHKSTTSYWEMTWNGRTLKAMQQKNTNGTAASGLISFRYDSDNIRTNKIVNGARVDYIYVDGALMREKRGDTNLTYFYGLDGVIGFEYKYANGQVSRYYYRKDIRGDIINILDNNGNIVVKYVYDAWGNHKVLDAAGTENTSDDFIGNINPIRYRGYYYDTETNLYYLINRYYDSETGRFISPDDISYLEPETIGGFNLYSYYWNNPLMYINSGTSFGSGEIVATSILAGDGGGIGLQRGCFVPEWLSIGVGAIPDIILGIKYLLAKGIHNKFVYSTNKFYMFPELGGNWHKYKISKYGYGKIASASFKQIITGNARSSWGAMAKSFGKTAALTAFINFGFNLYENNWQIDGVMLLNTVIDTAIGLGAYGLASGTTSLIVSGLAMAGLSVPGVVVVGAILLLSIGFDWLIREITGYKN